MLQSFSKNLGGIGVALVYIGRAMCFFPFQSFLHDDQQSAYLFQNFASWFLFIDFREREGFEKGASSLVDTDLHMPAPLLFYQGRFYANSCYCISALVTLFMER